MKLLVICALVSHLDTLPPEPDLYAALDTFHALQLDARLAEFELSEKGTWMNWVPSIGVGYTPSGDPRPTASFSLASVAANLNRRRDKKAKRRSLVAAAELERNDDRQRLGQFIQRHESVLSDLVFMRQLFDIDRELFEFYEAQAKAAELAPSEFLKRKKDFLRSEQGIREKGR